MPPTIHELLSDDVMRRYYTRVPRLPATLQWGDPWMVWATDHEGRWGSKMFPGYRVAWEKAFEMIKNTARYRDVAIVSRRVLFAPPAHAVWPAKFDWCSRCRRPSEFRERSPQHHALRGLPVLTEDSPRRCYYCGIRRVAMPWYASDLRG